MSRAARRLGVLAAVLCCLAALAFPTTSGASAAPRQAPGTTQAPEPPVRGPVSIESVAPSRLQPGSPVTVTGTVLNDSDEVWGDVQLGMLAASTPFTRLSEVADATRSDPFEDFTGEQILAPGTFDDIGDVAPGQSRSFSFTVPYDALELSGEQGVYWVGAEVRATAGDGGRGPIARTLTFLSLLEEQSAPPVELAMLWPLKAPVPWNGRTFLDDRLSEQMSPGGRLRVMAELGVSAASQRPLSWVVDPAVLEAAQIMSDGFSRADEELDADSAEAQAARDWLRLVRDSLRSNLVLGLPYANPDVPALAHAGVQPGLRKTQRAAARVFDDLGIARLNLLWPPAGRADREVVAAGAQVDAELGLLTRGSFDDPPRRPVVDVGTATSGQSPRAQTDVLPSLVLDGDRSRRGLRAQPGQSVLEWRQLILANTALRALNAAPARRSVLAMPSDLWWPDGAWRDAGLFAGLDVPWIEPVSAAALVGREHPRYDGGLSYPQTLRRRELGPTIMNRLLRLRRTTRTLDALLAEPAANLRRTDRAFGLSSSAAWRADRQTGQQIASDFLAANREAIDGIDLEAPNFVTLSSRSGRFPVSITNRLDQPVTVDLLVTARDPDMTVAPIDPVTLQRDQRVTVTVVTNAQGVGITTMTARMLTQQGDPFGEIAVFQVRTTQIGALVWVVMGIGGAVLFGAAARRIILRVRTHRRQVRGTR